MCVEQRHCLLSVFSDPCVGTVLGVLVGADAGSVHYAQNRVEEQTEHAAHEEEDGDDGTRVAEHGWPRRGARSTPSGETHSCSLGHNVGGAAAFNHFFLDGGLFCLVISRRVSRVHQPQQTRHDEAEQRSRNAACELENQTQLVRLKKKPGWKRGGEDEEGQNPVAARGADAVVQQRSQRLAHHEEFHRVREEHGKGEEQTRHVDDLVVVFEVIQNVGTSAPTEGEVAEAAEQQRHRGRDEDADVHDLRPLVAVAQRVADEERRVVANVCEGNDAQGGKELRVHESEGTLRRARVVGVDAQVHAAAAVLGGPADACVRVQLQRPVLVGEDDA
eukprot:Rhum_TRINITY_DN20916_c0_g1::Rhum_TRINITY_DN20916_c0_g1_i1::g.172603::m.172603